jgi:hypothetical protein
MAPYWHPTRGFRGFTAEDVAAIDTLKVLLAGPYLCNGKKMGKNMFRQQTLKMYLEKLERGIHSISRHAFNVC